MDTVGDGVDLIVGKHLLRDLAVLHGDSVNEAGEAQRDVGHVHQTVVETTGAFDGCSAVVAEHLVHLVEAELIVAGGDGSVGGEDTLLADSFHVGIGGVFQGSAG